MDVTARELADLLGVTPRHLGRLIERGMPPPSGRGRGKRYDGPACLSWQRAAAAAEGGNGTRSIRDEYFAALRDKLRLDLRQREGELVERWQVREDAATVATVAKARLRAIPTSVADRVASTSDPHAVKALLLTEIDAALEGLARLSAAGQDKVIDHDDDHNGDSLTPAGRVLSRAQSRPRRRTAR